MGVILESFEVSTRSGASEGSTSTYQTHVHCDGTACDRDHPTLLGGVEIEEKSALRCKGLVQVLKQVVPID